MFYFLIVDLCRDLLLCVIGAMLLSIRRRLLDQPLAVFIEDIRRVRHAVVGDMDPHHAPNLRPVQRRRRIQHREIQRDVADVPAIMQRPVRHRRRPDRLGY